jgi:hypothetical protein
VIRLAHSLKETETNARKRKKITTVMKALPSTFSFGITHIFAADRVSYEKAAFKSNGMVAERGCSSEIEMSRIRREV